MQTEKNLETPHEKPRSIAMIGLMGAGKSSVGRRLAKKMGLPFVDADDEIEKAAGLSIDDIFEVYGEDEFRAGERRVLMRLLDDEPQVIATGGGAFMDKQIREKIGQAAFSVWLKADLDTLVERTSRRNDRPLLNKGDPKAILGKLIEERYPVYAGADITVVGDNSSLDATVERIIEALGKQEPSS